MSDKRYLIVKGCAGLGNRLITLYSAINYSIKTNRILIVDWRDGQFDVKGEDAFRRCFEILNVQIDSLETIEQLRDFTHSSDLFRQNSRAGVYDLYYEWHSRFWERIPNRFFGNSRLKKLRRRWQPLQKGNYFNSLQFGSDLDFAENKEVVYYIDQLPYIDYSKMPVYIGLKKPIAGKINTMAAQMQIGSMVGVHIRNTDKKPTSKIERFVAYLKKNNAERPLFLSTDSQPVEDVFKRNFERVFVSEKHRPELKSEGLHQWALYNNKDDLKYQLYEESVMDMFLLSKCEHLYYQGNSSFSNVSRVYHQNKAKCYDWLSL